MFKFEVPEHLYAFIAIPVLIAFFVAMWYARKAAIERFGNTTLMNQLMPQMSRYKHTIKFVLLMLGLATLIIGWANPQWGAKREKVKRKSVDLFIALDISESMLCEDISPNRLERAKRFSQRLINELKGDRIGVIIFAGNAYLQMPLTTDYAAANLFLRSANTGMAPTQGTAIDEAIKEARDNGLLIYTVGVGTERGGLIPVNISGFRDNKRDKNGQTVRTSLNEPMLQELAEIGDGAYFNISDGDQVITALRQRIDKIEKREFEARSFTEYESYFQYFIAIALLFILAEFFLSYRKSKWLEGKDIF